MSDLIHYNLILISLWKLQCVPRGKANEKTNSRLGSLGKQLGPRDLPESQRSTDVSPCGMLAPGSDSLPWLLLPCVAREEIKCRVGSACLVQSRFPTAPFPPWHFPGSVTLVHRTSFPVVFSSVGGHIPNSRKTKAQLGRASLKVTSVSTFLGTMIT